VRSSAQTWPPVQVPSTGSRVSVAGGTAAIRNSSGAGVGQLRSDWQLFNSNARQNAVLRGPGPRVGPGGMRDFPGPALGAATPSQLPRPSSPAMRRPTSWRYSHGSSLPEAASSTPAAFRDILEEQNVQRAVQQSLEEAEEQRRRDQVEAQQALEAAEAAAAPLQAGANASSSNAGGSEGASSSSRPAPAPAPGLKRTFAPCRWLSDASISFVYSRLLGGSPEAGPCTDSAGKLPEDVMLMDPVMAFWLTVQRDPNYVREAVTEMKLEDKDLVLCPINDTRDVRQSDGGSHWGLLVWDRRGVDANAQVPAKGGMDLAMPALAARASRHSSAGPVRPSRTIESLARGPYVSEMPDHLEAGAAGYPGRFVYYDSGFYRSPGLLQASTLARRLAGQAVKVATGRCARQTNGYDCGMYVLLFSEIIVKCFLAERASAKEATEIMDPCTREPSIGRSSLGPGTSASGTGLDRRGDASSWEAQLAAITPKQVSDRRAFYFSMLTNVSAVAAAGA